MGKKILLAGGILPLFLLLLPSYSFASSINLYLKPAPFNVQEQVKKDYTAKLGKRGPTELGRKIFKNNFRALLPKISGFIALYGGYVDYSNTDGNITFPLIHKEPIVYIVITPKINAVRLHGNTIAYEGFAKDAKSKIYKVERKQEGKPATFYWQVAEEKRPEHNQIDPFSIVLLTKPKNIVVPTGDFIAEQNVNLIIPSVYVVGNIDHAKTLFDFLDIRRFFEQINEKTLAKDKVVRKIMENN
jgi:hypothetical protein